jgi:hypothetical protein
LGVCVDGDLILLYGRCVKPPRLDGGHGRRRKRVYIVLCFWLFDNSLLIGSVLFVVTTTLREAVFVVVVDS